MALVLTGTLTIDCNNISCLTFQDTTGGYSVSNTTGYGGGVNPEISDIVSVSFTIVDGDGNDFTTTDIGYLPNSAGTSTICLTQSDFSDGTNTIVLVPGATYGFYYHVNFADGGEELFEQFTFPCCGSGVTSNLAINFAIQQNIGCGSITFADVTGSYDATTNTGGYGTPNPAYSDIDHTIITFQLSNGQTVEYTDFVPTANDFSVTINAAELGYTTANIPDQVVTVTYQVFAAGDCQIGYKTTGVLLYCNTQSCINQKTLATLNNDCSCDSTDTVTVDNVMQLWFELDAIKLAAQGNMNCVNGKIEALYQKCTAGCSQC